MLVATMHFRTPSGAWGQSGHAGGKVSFGEEKTEQARKAHFMPVPGQKHPLLCPFEGHQETCRPKPAPSGRSWPEGQTAAGSRWAGRPRQARSPAPPGAPRSGQTSPTARGRVMRLRSPKPSCGGLPSPHTGDHSTHLNVLLARHEDKDVPRGPRQVYLQGLLHRGLHVIFLWGLSTAEGTRAPQSAAPRGHTASSI